MKGVPFHRVFAQARRWENVLSSSPLDLSRPLHIMKAAPPSVHFDRTLASIRDSPGAFTSSFPGRANQQAEQGVGCKCKGG